MSRNELYRFDLIFPQLCELVVAENKISILDGIDRMPFLEILDASQNQI
jgi:Leucine-rich repeat (LRR) protein